MASRGVSQAEIAKRLGISRNAVSLALSGRPGVSMETREAVRRTAQILGYRRRARKADRQGLQTIALLFNESLLHFPETMFFGPVLQHLQKELALRGYHLMVFGVSDEDDRQLNLPSWPPGTVQGILALSRFSPRFVLGLQERAPVIWIDHYDETVPCDKVVTENRLGSFLAVDYLVGSGLDRIGFFGGVNLAPSYAERLHGYRTALTRRGIALKPAWEWTEADVDPVRIAAFLDALNEHPDAWFCVNDVLAVNLLRVLQERGLSVPDDVAILGFDDLALAETASPALSSVHVDVGYYAARVVASLARRLEDPQCPVEVVRIMPTLVARVSTAVTGAQLAAAGPERPPSEGQAR